MSRVVIAAIVIPLMSVSLLAADPAPNYEGQIKTILSRHCLKCHSGDRPRGDLDLSTFSSLMQGGVSGKAVIAGQSDTSSLYTMTAHLEEPKMPPNSPKIPQSELDLLKKWIDGGAVEKTAIKTMSPMTSLPKKSDTLVSPGLSGLVTPAELPRQSAITALASNGQIVAYPGFKQVLLVDLASQKLRAALPFPDGEVHLLRFSRSGKSLLVAGGVGGQSGVVTLFDVATGQRLGTVADSSDAILAADLSPDEKRIVFGGPTRIVKVTEWPTGKIVHNFKTPTDWVLAASFSPDGLLVAAADRFGGVHLWEARTGKEFLSLRAHTKAATALVWRADSAALATASEDGQVKIWDLHTSTSVQQWTAHELGILDLAWPSTQTIITAGRDRLVKVWDPTGKYLTQHGPMADVVLKVAATQSGSVIAGDWSGEVKLWAANQQSAVRLPLPTKAKIAPLAMIPVPLPEVVPVVAPTTAPLASPSPINSMASPDELKRKRETLAMLEASTERLKDEAARNPANPSLTKAYLQLCEAVLAMKADVIATESALRKP